MSLLEIRNLSVEFQTVAGTFRAVDGVDIDLKKNDLLSIVGESGSGKSVSMLAMMGLLPWTANVTADKMEFAGRDLLTISSRERRKIIGKDISMIFQEPMSSLNPCFYGRLSDRRIPEAASRGWTAPNVKNAASNCSNWSAFRRPKRDLRLFRTSCPAA